MIMFMKIATMGMFIVSAFICGGTIEFVYNRIKHGEAPQKAHIILIGVPAAVAIACAIALSIM
jgi:hypothetical protein